MNEEWPLVRIGDIAEFVKRGKAPLYSEEGLVVLNQKCIRPGNTLDLAPSRRTDSDSRPVPDWALLRVGDTLINSTGRGTLGRACYVARLPEPATVDSHVTIVRPAVGKVEPAFLGLACSTLDAHFANLESGSTNQTELSRAAVSETLIPLPPLSVQRRIVDLMEHLDNQALRLKSEQRASADAYQALLAVVLRRGSGAAERSLAQVLRLEVDRQTVLPQRTYPMVGVANRGQGVFLSGEVLGTDTKYAHLNRVASGQVVMRKLTAWEGPIAVVPPEAHGRYASAEFPTFTVDRDVADIEFLSHLCRWPGLWERMKLRVTGTVQRRKRLNPDQLLSVLVPLPPLAQQKETARLLSDLREVAQTLTTEEAALKQLRGALLHTMLTDSLTLPDSYDELLGVAS